MRNLILYSILFLFLAGCASINSVSLTPIPAERKVRVKTERDKVIFLGFNFENDFIDDAVEDLKRQCPNGKITGLLTKDENINYFIYILWKKQITATGFCVPTTTVSNNKSKVRGVTSEDEAQTVESEL